MMKQVKFLKLAALSIVFFVAIFGRFSLAEETSPSELQKKAFSTKEIVNILDAKFAEGNYSRTGADQCLRCHDQSAELNATGIFRNIHGSRTQPGSPFQGLQCETCHGPAGEHTKTRLKDDELREPMITFGQFSPVPADKQNSVCLSCHKDNLDHHWQGSEHEKANVACASCHSVHQAHDPVKQKQSQVEVCGTCHQSQLAATHQRSSHPLLNGQMGCTDCHSPHQSTHLAELNKPTVNENCYGCHVEKRGPLLWEHQPVTEDCSTCHNPHGSINEALLSKRQPQLCQSCHVAAGHPSVPYADNGVTNIAAVFVLGDSCTNCHTQVHGSNHPSGHRFQR